MTSSRTIRSLLAPACACALAGCNTVVLNPAGYIAAQQAQLVVLSTLLMLVIIVPVIVLTLVFAWRYRASNTGAPYTPEWDHSIQLELVIWAAPLLIIIALGALTWIGTHTLDPYRALSRLGPQRPIPRDVEPLNIQVVAMDWKWLFIYPDQDIAVVNELAAPVDVPVRFQITSTSVMNSFYVPALAGQIYAMPGMQTTLHAVINFPGTYDGFCANYSGSGFSDMRFKFIGMSAAEFESWVQKAKSAGRELSRGGYTQLEKPSEREPVRRYSAVAPDLFDAVVNRSVDQAEKCMREIMMMDEHRVSAAPALRTRIAFDPRSDAQVCTAQNTLRSALLPVTYRD